MFCTNNVKFILIASVVIVNISILFNHHGVAENHQSRGKSVADISSGATMTQVVMGHWKEVSLFESPYNGSSVQTDIIGATPN